MEKYSKFTLVTFLIIILNVSLIVPLVNGQPDDEYLPVLLIHGYASDASVWNNWLVLLGNEGITAHAVTFPDDPTTPIDEDKCGRAVDHAAQLNKIIESFKKQTGKEKINIVTHSKGGLDSRVYLANNQSNTLVANLIMIGTPNAGSPIADSNHETDPCKPAVYDLMTTAEVNKVKKNANTKYYTIAGNWISVYSLQCTTIFGPCIYIDINCPPLSNWLNWEGWTWVALQNMWRFQIIGDDDGVVPVDSVEEPGEFTRLPQTNNCHTNLFSDEEYNYALPILKQK
jgi:pimeloyl-ACP methyl ester carboxylesterase